MRNDGAATIVNCGCALILVAFNIFVGGWSVNYLLMAFAAKTIPFFWAAAIGLFAGEISVPVAIVVAILKHFGVL